MDSKYYIYLKPSKENCFDTPETSYKIKEKINIKKSIKEIIKENINNFEKPRNDIEFIENQILLDEIIAEKYKEKEINFDKEIKYLEKTKNGNKIDNMKTLLKFFESQNCKVYYDNSINEHEMAQLQNYFFSESSSKYKIKFHLKINKNKLNEENVEKVINLVKHELKSIAGIPIEDLYVTNIREGSLKFEIFRFSRHHNNFLNDIISDFGSEFIKQHREQLIQLLEDIYENLNESNIYNNHMENAVEVRPIIHNYLFNRNLIFNNRHDKFRGDFGLRYYLNIFPYHKKSVERNGFTYYYPNERWEGFGLKVLCREINGHHLNSEDLFYNGQWINGYCNLTKTQCSLRINNIRQVIVQEMNNSGFGLVLQCKIMKSPEIIVEPNGNVRLRNPDQDSIANYIIPYRLLKKQFEN